MTEPTAAPQPSSPALDLGVAVGLATALVYAAGWAYAYRWFAQFDLGLVGLGLPFETLLMYGFWTLREHWYLLLAYASGMLIWSWYGPGVRVWILRTAPVWLLLAFVLVYLAGGQSANARYQDHKSAEFGCFPRAMLGLTQQQDRTPDIAALATQLADSQYRLLIQTQTGLVLIKPKRQGPPVTTLVPISSIHTLRLSSTERTCRP